MGWASFTAFMVAAVQKPADGSLQPIENSPPGIQTMPLGALLGTGSLLGTVGAKADPPMAGAPSSAEMAGESHATLKTTSVNVPNKKAAGRRAFVKGSDSEAANRTSLTTGAAPMAKIWGSLSTKSVASVVDGAAVNLFHNAVEVETPGFLAGSKSCGCSLGAQFSTGYRTLVVY
jgi:hypothetical protein